MAWDRKEINPSEYDDDGDDVAGRNFTNASNMVLQKTCELLQALLKYMLTYKVNNYSFSASTFSSYYSNQLVSQWN